MPTRRKLLAGFDVIGPAVDIEARLTRSKIRERFRMARRDRLGELIAIKDRKGRRGGRIPDPSDVWRLREAWANSTESKELFATLLPVRLVTLIEVFCRCWVQKLIDRGPPYADRAIDLRVDIKYDLALARDLHGQAISLGLLVSHS